MRRLKNTSLRQTALLVAIVCVSTSLHSAILDDVKTRGSVRCGVSTELDGFAKANSLDEYAGFNVDMCRAVASAIFNDSESVDMIPLSSTEHFDALLDGQVDILSRHTSWTLKASISFGEFAGIYFYDGQGFLVPRSTGYLSALELDDQPVCVSRNTKAALNAADFFTASNLRYRPVFFEDQTTSVEGYLNGECIALTSNRSLLAAKRSTFDQPDAHVIVPEVISKEPLGPMVPFNELAWANIVRWSLHCMINAEELGVTQSNIDNDKTNDSPAIRLLTGDTGAVGKLLGLDPQWCSRIIRQVGNYGESYERHLGPETPIGLPRGINALWSNGGLLYALPIR